MLSIDVSSELEDLRKGAGFTRQELADLLVTSRQAIWRIETGQQIPDAETWLNWVHACTDVPLKLDFEHGGKVLQPA